LTLRNAQILQKIFDFCEYCGWGGDLPPIVLQSKNKVGIAIENGSPPIDQSQDEYLFKWMVGQTFLPQEQVIVE
jgi:hypothetical protein